MQLWNMMTHAVNNIWGSPILHDDHYYKLKSDSAMALHSPLLKENLAPLFGLMV